MVMKRVVVALIVCFSCIASYGQRGSLWVSVDSTAKNYIEMQQSTEYVQGFTICVFADNGQSARSEATATLSNIRQILPNMYARMQYENPFFKVYVGRCLNRSEAVRLLGSIKGIYPRAIISSTKLDIALFGKPPMIDTIAAKRDTMALDETLLIEYNEDLEDPQWE